MPKQKTHSGAKKRFKITGSGQLKTQQAGMRHNLEHKSSRRTRRLNQDQVLSKADIMDNVWGSDFDGSDNIVEVYIRNLRKKIDIPFGRESIVTLRGAGYQLRPVGASSSPGSSST